MIVIHSTVGVGYMYSPRRRLVSVLVAGGDLSRK